MTAYILHYRERNGKRAPLLNKYVALFGMRGITIDPSGQRKRDTALRFASVAEAMASPLLEGLTWVWLDPRGEKYLDEYEHPKDDVVYCVGDDVIGFDGMSFEEIPGEKIKVRDWGETFAACVVPMVAYDRHLFLHGRRK